MANFTVKTLDNLPDAKVGKRDTYHDDKVNGLTLRVTSKGIKSFVIRKRIQGKLAMNTLGRYPAMTIDQAREAARGVLNAYSVGTNPNKEQRDNNLKGVTLKQTMNDYITSRNKNLKDKTISDYWILFNKLLIEWKDKELKSITRDMVEKKHINIGETSIYRANATMRLFSRYQDLLWLILCTGLLVIIGSPLESS